MLKLVLTKKAENDLTQIANYTLQNFGYEQAEHYYSSLTNTLEILTTQPNLGQNFSHIKVGLKRFVFKHHSIYFLAEKDRLVIYRILNQKQDPIRNL